MRLVAGCDGGGTRTRVQVAAFDSNGALMGTAQCESGPGNILVDPVASMRNVKSATEQAITAAGFPADQHIDCMVAALAGAGRAEQRDDAQSRLLETLNVDRVEVVPDAAILFSAAEVSGAAVALIAGTGSIAWARDDLGKLHRAGGWGPLIGDEGSGHWIGLEAIKHSVRKLQSESKQSRLTKLVLKQLGAHHVDQLIAIVYSEDFDRASVAGLAAGVFEVAPLDDDAADILGHAAGHLVALIAEVHSRANISGPTKWVCAGGVALNQKSWLRQVHENCRRLGIILADPQLVENPVVGAVKIASCPPKKAFPGDAIPHDC